jgi:hypothetical protein
VYCQIKVTDITGKEWVGVKIPTTKDYLNEDDFLSFTKILENFTDMNHLSITRNQSTLYFNPKNLTCVEIVVKDE